MYKTDLKSFEVTQTVCVNPVSCQAGKVVYISEPGLYQSIFSSWPEAAERLRTWMTDVLMPG